MSRPVSHSYDVLVVGSGIGSLTTAAILAKVAKKKVLLLERHWTVGGLTHEFERQRKYSWDVGIHYVGQAAQGSHFPARLFQFISDGNLEWDAIEAPFDTFVYPDFRLPVPNEPKAYLQRIIDLFPDEERAIRQYFKDVKAVAQWAVFQSIRAFAPNWIGRVLGAINRRKAQAQQTTQQYLDNHFKSERLKALLVSQWGDYGVTPDKSLFSIHALIVSHYLEGAFYPKGGSKSIAEHILPVIKAAGGDYLLNCEVQEILVEDNRAVGCRCQVQRGRELREEIFYAPVVVSGAGAYPTFRRLLRQPLFPELEAMQTGGSAITVYLGLRESPAKLGVSGGNFWIYETYDHNGLPQQQAGDDLNLQFCFVSFPSLKDPSKTAHTAELITMMPYQKFEPWASLPWQQRGEAYEALKATIAQKLIRIADKALPGFAELVDYVEVATPLSMEKFTGRAGGLLYGMPQTQDRSRSACFAARTPIQHLYQTGNDVFALGLVGAMMGGLAAACSVLGTSNFLKIMSKITAARPAKKD